MSTELIQTLTIWVLILTQFFTILRINRLVARIKELEDETE